MHALFALIAALPLAFASDTSSLKLCTDANYTGDCSSFDLTWEQCYKIEEPFYKHLGSAQAFQTLTRIYDAANCSEDNMVAMLTSPSAGADLRAAGREAEYVLVQECTGCT